MRLTRRRVLIGSAGAAGAALVGGIGSAALSKPAVPDEPSPIEIRSYPLDHFSVREREQRRFGALTFRSGLELQSATEGFGGLSGLWRSPDGRGIVAVTDNGQWLTATLVSENGRLAGVTDAVMGPILGRDGRPLRQVRSYDTEALTIANGTAYVGIERTHEVMRFDWGASGMRARGQPVAVPPEVKKLPRNKGIEGIAVAPAGTPLAGALVAVAERARWEEGAPTRGFILTGPRRGVFEIATSDSYEPTDIAFLPSGDLLMLERRFKLLTGVAARIRRLSGESLRPGAQVDGPVIFEAGGAYQVDNMEGLALHRDPSGALLLTLVSDNNFSILQRTLLLEFELAED